MDAFENNILIIVLKSTIINIYLGTAINKIYTKSGKYFG